MDFPAWAAIPDPADLRCLLEDVQLAPASSERASRPRLLLPPPWVLEVVFLFLDLDDGFAAEDRRLLTGGCFNFVVRPILVLDDAAAADAASAALFRREDVLDATAAGSSSFLDKVLLERLLA